MTKTLPLCLHCVLAPGCLAHLCALSHVDLPLPLDNNDYSNDEDGDGDGDINAHHTDRYHAADLTLPLEG